MYPQVCVWMHACIVCLSVKFILWKGTLFYKIICELFSQELLSQPEQSSENNRTTTVWISATPQRKDKIHEWSCRTVINQKRAAELNMTKMTKEM